MRRLSRLALPRYYCISIADSRIFIKRVCFIPFALRRGESLRLHLAVYAFYLAITVAVTWPLAADLSTRLVGHPFGDSTEYARHIWWMAQAARSGQNPFFDPLLLHPDGLSSVLLWSIPLQSFPAWLFALALPLPAAFNLSILLRLALNGWAMFVLVRSLTPDATERKQKKVTAEDAANPEVLRSLWLNLPALLGGLVFMLYPAFQGQLGIGHTGLLALWPTPLLIAALVRLASADDARTVRRWMLVSAALVPVTLWGSLVLLAYLVAPALLMTLLAAGSWRALRRMLLALTLGGLLALPFVVPALVETAAQPPRLREGGSVMFSAPLLGVVSPSFFHPLYAGFVYPRNVYGVDPFESASYIGLAAGALAFLGARWRRDTPPAHPLSASRPWLLLGVVAWVFSLGPLLKVLFEPLMVQLDGYATHVPLPWALFQNLPLLSIARTPARFSFAVGLAVAVLAGIGAARLQASLTAKDAAQEKKQAFTTERPHASRPLRALRAPWPLWLKILLFSLLFPLIIFDYLWFWPLPTIPAAIPDAVAALRQRDDVRAVFDIPWGHLLVDKDGMYLQTAHQQPMIAGHIARRTPVDPAKATLLELTLDPALLDAAGVDVIILHRDWDDAEGVTEARLRERLGTPFYEDERLALFNAPPAPDAPPAFLTASLLPDVLTNSGDLYFYAPAPGTATLTGVIDGGARTARLLLNETPILEFTVHGATALRVPILIERAGYHTLTLALDPPCPDAFDARLRCRALRLANVALEAYAPR